MLQIEVMSNFFNMKAKMFILLIILSFSTITIAQTWEWDGRILKPYYGGLSGAYDNTPIPVIAAAVGMLDSNTSGSIEEKRTDVLKLYLGWRRSVTGVLTILI